MPNRQEQDRTTSHMLKQTHLLELILKELKLLNKNMAEKKELAGI